MIKYPNKKTTAVSRQTYTNTRGMNLEKDLNDSNVFYCETGRAVVYKKPTPINVVRVQYEKRSSAKIVEAYYQSASTTDYNGIYRGKAIDFEAKETKSKTEFRLDLLHNHQVIHLERVLKQEGIAFIIVRFTSYNLTYLLDANIVIAYYRTKDKKSIPLSVFEQEGFLIQEGYTPRLKYLDVVDTLYFQEDINEKTK